MSERIPPGSGWQRVLTAMLAMVGFAAIGVGVGARTASAEIDRAKARAEMRTIYASMQVLLPLSVDDEAFRNPQNKSRIREVLKTLAERAEQVAGHVGRGDRRIQYLGGSLARESKESLRRFEAGQLDGAQFYVRQLTSFCVACHSGLPSPADSPLSRDFVSEKTLRELPLPQRAELQIATRRFDDALATLETVFESPLVHPAELLDPLTQYLTVAIRVKHDLDRPRPVLAKLASRPDLWTNLRSDLVRWQQTLDLHAKDSVEKPSLASARALLDEANEITAFPTDRQGLVHYLLASSQLLRYLEARANATDRDAAEAYYLLGLIESRTSLDDFVSEADFYLETAIRMAPRDPIGAEAFRLLEEETEVGWSGSGGTHMPADVRENLDVLRALVHPEKASARQ